MNSQAETSSAPSARDGDLVSSEGPTRVYAERSIKPQMSVRLHAQRAAVFVAEPTRDGGNIDSALNADCGKEMSQIVVRDSLHSDLLGRLRHADLTL
jgi:hypothetical protein